MAILGYKYTGTLHYVCMPYILYVLCIQMYFVVLSGQVFSDHLFFSA